MNAPAASLTLFVSPSAHARAARAELEAALDAAGWPWRRRLSLYLDLLILLEESSGVAQL